MAFTKQHFEAIAQAISSNTRKGPLVGASWIDAPAFIDALVELFGDDNARFDAQRFRAACAPPTKEDNA